MRLVFICFFQFYSRKLTSLQHSDALNLSKGYICKHNQKVKQYTFVSGNGPTISILVNFCSWDLNLGIDVVKGGIFFLWSTLWNHTLIRFDKNHICFSEDRKKNLDLKEMCVPLKDKFTVRLCGWRWSKF